MESILLEMAALLADNLDQRKRREDLHARVAAYVDAEIARRSADLAAARREAESYE
jgi:cell division septum initiation protein DivIVA